MTDRISVFHSSPATTFALEADIVETQASYGSHGRWRVRLYLRANNGPGGSTGSYFGGSGYQDGRINGGIVITHGPVTPFLPSGYANGAQRWRDGPVDWWVNANENGYWAGASTSLPVQMGLDYGSIEAVYSGSLPIPRIARAPGAPGQPSVSNLTPTSAKFTWGAAARGNANITDYALYISTDPAFGSHVFAQWVGNVLTFDPGSILNPGTTYYVRTRARNGDGTGGYSAARSFTTLPAVAPGISVAPSLSGLSATVTLTPPGGATGVSKYTVERRIGTGPATSIDTPTSPLVVDSLTPGVTYEWRASAWFGAYQSPWSNWLPITQPNTNTSPGDYFDGNTAPRDDLTFEWASTPNNSISYAYGVPVEGWEGVFTGTAAGCLQRVTGPLVDAGDYSARLIFTVDADEAGSGLRMVPAAGTFAAIEPGATYVVSAHFILSRDQRMAASLVWVDDADAIISEVAGSGFEATGGSVYRLSANAQAPAEAVGVALALTDVEGDGWSLWESGDWIIADAAMVSLSTLFPYFDGDTPDTIWYDHQWLGDPNESASVRLELEPSSVVDPLADPDCPPLPAPPVLPSIEAECIDEVGTWRRYAVTIPESEVHEWTTALPTLVLTTGSQAERQVRIRYYPAPEGEPTEVATAGDWEAEMILAYIPPNTEIILDGVSQLVTASVDGGDPIAANRLLFGTGGVPATWPELRCGIGYVVTMDVPLEAPSGNLGVRLIVTQRM